MKEPVMSAQITRRVPSLDFLRSMAILLVVLAHATLAFGAPKQFAWLQLGGTGVDLFFVLSGWLLGCHLFKELDRSGTINIQRFWRRRWLRTLPAYFAVLAVTVSQNYITGSGLRFPFEYLYFAQNYTGLPIFHVSWSLCVEEHFYLLVAPLIMLGTRYRRLIPAIIITVLVVPAACRFTGLYASIKQSHVRFDGCALGVILALVASYRPTTWTWLTSQANRIGGVALAIYTSNYAAYYYIGQRWFTDPGWFCWLAVAFVLFAVSSKAARENLTFPGCQYLATRSYAVYLLHPEILALLQPYRSSIPFGIFVLSTLGGSCLASEVLYRFVELPVMAWRDRTEACRTETDVSLVSSGKNAV